MSEGYQAPMNHWANSTAHSMGGCCMYTPKCQTEWGTWPQTILNHIIMFGLQILRHTHQVLYAWLNYGGISLLLSLEYLQPPTTSYFGRLSSRWHSFVFLFPQCLQSKSRRVEDVSTTCTTKQAQHCGTVQFARFTFFLFFSPPLHSGPFRASCRGPPGTKMEEQEHELQNLNSAIAAKVHTAVSLDGDHHLGSLLVFCGICHEPSCFFLHICRLTT